MKTIKNKSIQKLRRLYQFRILLMIDNSPVVLSHGMHSNLLTWNDFATKLAESGRDSWLIEMYGGPTTDSDCKPTGNYYCPNYTFTDLKTYYWPALVAGVQQYSGKNNLSYVGYDLGCTVALESLELYENGKNNAGYYFDTITGNYVLMDLSNKPINTFVGLGCIGNFSNYLSHYTGQKYYPYFSDYINKHYYYFFPNTTFYNSHAGHLAGNYFKSINFLKDEGISLGLSKLFGPYFITSTGTSLPTAATVLTDVVVSTMSSDLPGYLNTNKISLNVYRDLSNWTVYGELPIGSQVNISNILIIQSTFDKDECYKNIFGNWSCKIYDHSDKFIIDEDQRSICKNINSSNKYYVGYRDIPHFSGILNPNFGEDEKVMETIDYFIKNNNLKTSINYQIISEISNCS